MKKAIMIIAALVFLVCLIGAAKASFWACFNYEERINYCNPDIEAKYRVCDVKTGCIRCMSDSSTTECYNGAFINRCNSITQNCQSVGNGSVSITELNFSVSEPDENAVYNKRSVFFDLESSKKASYYWIDNIEGRGRWKRICSGCYDFERGVSFKDGLQDITIKAIASNGEELLVSRKFFVDSSKPRIKKVLPKEKYMSTDFSVVYDEANIKSVTLNYGNYNKGYKTASLENCPSGKNKICSIDLSLEEYDGEEIFYWFEIIDIAGNSAVSKESTSIVDETFPDILNHPFYTQSGKYINFNITIKEDNLEKVSYTDLSQKRPISISLCTRLKNELCIKKKTFSAGNHVLDIEVLDKAGNAIVERISFTI